MGLALPIENVDHPIRAAGCQEAALWVPRKHDRAPAVDLRLHREELLLPSTRRVEGEMRAMVGLPSRNVRVRLHHALVAPLWVAGVGAGEGLS